MGKIPDEFVPIPDCCIPYSNGRVNFMVRVSDNEKPKPLVVGWACAAEDVPLETRKKFKEETQFMRPNNSYFDKFGNEYLRYFPGRSQKIRKHQLIVGLYILVLAIATKIGLYQILVKWYKPHYANAIMDFVMYSIIYQTSKANTFVEMMDNHVLFSQQPYSDSWYSSFFKSKMNEDINMQCVEDWLDHNLKQNNIEEVSISIDGTNLNCESKTNDLAAHGHAKTHKYIKIVNLLWAVISDGPHKGRPISYTIHRGNVTDNRHMDKMLAFWREHKINVRVSIFDRGFPNGKLLNNLNQAKIPFQAMLKESSEGFKTMLKKHGEELQLDVRYVLEDGSMSGITESNIKPYKNSDLRCCVGLFYDIKNGAERKVHMMAKVMKLKRELEIKLNQKPKKAKKENDEEDSADIDTKQPKIPKMFTVSTENGRKIVSINYDIIDPIWKAKGISAQISSENISAQKMNDNYNCRDASEKQFGILKSQLGFNVAGVRGTASWVNKLFVAFNAAIIRNEIMIACKEEGFDTNQVIKELSSVCYIKSGDYYYFDQNIPGRVEKLYSHFGITTQTLEDLSPYVNSRYRVTGSARNMIRKTSRVMPKPFNDLPIISNHGDVVSDVIPDSQKAVTEQPLVTPPSDSAPSKRGRGRPPGAKNKKTLEKEEAERQRRLAEGLPAEVSPEEKRKPGRPLGAKNKKTLEKEEAERQRRLAEGLPAEEPPKEKRKPGRPLGSKNRATLEREAAASGAQQAQDSDECFDEGFQDAGGTGAEQAPKEHKGRAKGVKNKKTLEREAREAELRAAGQMPDPPEKRNPGRPKGARNFATLALEKQDRELAQFTGIDILGERSGTPTSRYKRAQLRKEAEAKLAEMAAEPHTD